jgi:protocatechuate 3,4-dioxygenase alpha subunit
VTTARTPSQTIGPFFQFALPWREGPHVVPEGTAESIWLGGRLLDGRGDPVIDGLIETWQADQKGLLPGQTGAAFGTHFRGFGRCSTDREGWYKVFTLKPGKIRDARDVVHAPHIVVSIFARGLLKRAVTRVYFGDEQAANETDPVLSSIADPAARTSLIALPAPGGYRFDIRLQGEEETLFFDV